MKYLLVLSVILCGCGCGNGEPEPHVTPVPGVERCGEACARMAMVGPDGGACEESQPVQTVDGGLMSCTDFCVYQHDNGVYWNTDCLTTITTCVEIESVCNIPPPG
jgi:hypothetical protein